MALENFTADYTEVDEDGDITVAANTLTIDTLRRDAVSHVYRDMGAGHFSGDFTHNVTIDITGTTGGGSSGCYVWAVSDAVGNQSGVDGIACFYSKTTEDYQIRDWDDSSGDTTVGVGQQTVDVEFSRTTTTAAADFYDQDEPPNLLDTVSTPCQSTAYRYVQALVSFESGTFGTDTISLTIANLDLNEAAPPAGFSRPLVAGSLAHGRKGLVA